ncbi:hypothetical protein ACIQB5_51475 [Streptomyces sp. NPDC088560]|uniref:hypothetical protein n=1 Tax=Streptomyces sp. NPDC088560 TaxID=3365868 RepID=UPI00381B4789
MQIELPEGSTVSATLDNADLKLSGSLQRFTVRIKSGDVDIQELSTPPGNVKISHQTQPYARLAAAASHGKFIFEHSSTETDRKLEKFHYPVPPHFENAAPRTPRR